MKKTVKKSKNYKYTLHELLWKLPREQERIAKNFLPVHLGVSKETFKAWVYLKEDEVREIPGTKLLLIARYFEVHPEELFTNELPVCNYEEMRESSNKKNLEG